MKGGAGDAGYELCLAVRLTTDHPCMRWAVNNQAKDTVSELRFELPPGRQDSKFESNQVNFLLKQTNKINMFARTITEFRVSVTQQSQYQKGKGD